MQDRLARTDFLRDANCRAGSLMPALALVLVVVMCGVAFVVDLLWLGVTRTELRAAAEAAALAAARELVSDDRLRPESNSQARLMKARWAAARIAAENRAAGELLTLDIDDFGDVQFGQLVEVAGSAIFIEDETEPTSVVVRARRANDRMTAVRLPVHTAFTPSTADVVATAEATLDNDVFGLRPVGELPIPALPLAIQSGATMGTDNDGLEVKPSAVPTWSSEIERRSGADRFGYDSTSGQLHREADGIPEIGLRTAEAGQGRIVETFTQDNAFFVGLRSDVTTDDLTRQIRNGWSVRDLEAFGGELLLDRGPLTVAGLRGVEAGVIGDALRSSVGQSRICLLYDRVEVGANSPVAQLRCVGFVAGRVMAVQEVSETQCEIVFQPAVMTSRSAVVASELVDAPSRSQDHDKKETPKNRYLYKLRLTN